MDWMNQLGGLLQQYTGANAQQHPQTVNDDYDQFARTAPQDAIADAMAGSFRSDMTPPFPQMLGGLFGQSHGMQRASILNTLLATVGPTLMANLLSKHGTNLGSLLKGGQVTPEVADQIPAGAVEQAAAEAQQRDPSVVDRVSQVYAENPMMFKALGAAAMAVALRHLAGQKRGGLL